MISRLNTAFLTSQTSTFLTCPFASSTTLPSPPLTLQSRNTVSRTHHSRASPQKPNTINNHSIMSKKSRHEAAKAKDALAATNNNTGNDHTTKKKNKLAKPKHVAEDADEDADEEKTDTLTPQATLELASLTHWLQSIANALELHLHFVITLSKHKDKAPEKEKDKQKKKKGSKKDRRVLQLAVNSHEYWPADYCDALAELVPLVPVQEANQRLWEKMAQMCEDEAGVKTSMVREVVGEVKGNYGKGMGSFHGGRGGRGGRDGYGGRGGRGGRGGGNDSTYKSRSDNAVGQDALRQVARGKITKFYD